MDTTFVNILATIFKPLFTIAAMEWNFGGIKFSIIQFFLFCMFIAFILKLVKGMGNTGGGK